MGRLVRISIYALIILILYFWVTAIVRSYQNKSVDEENIQIADTLSLDSMGVDSTNIFADDTSALISDGDVVDGKIDYESLDKKVKEMEEKPVPAPSPKKESINTIGKSANQQKPSVKPNETKLINASFRNGDGGQFKVMAGSYLLKDNASKMVKKLKSIGYKNAEIVVFNASGYHSVIACRHTSEGNARSAVAELKSKGIDSFIKN